MLKDLIKGIDQEKVYLDPFGRLEALRRVAAALLPYALMTLFRSDVVSPAHTYRHVRSATYAWTVGRMDSFAFCVGVSVWLGYNGVARTLPTQLDQAEPV